MYVYAWLPLPYAFCRGVYGYFVDSLRRCIPWIYFSSPILFYVTCHKVECNKRQKKKKLPLAKNRRLDSPV